MAALDQLDLVTDLVEGAEDAVDAVAGIAVDALHAERAQPLEHEGSDGVRHAHRLPRPGRRYPALSGGEPANAKAALMCERCVRACGTLP